MAGGVGWLAPGVKTVIEARLHRLSPRAGAWVNAVAVLGQHAPFEVSCQIAGLVEDEALTLLDETTARGLLRESIGGTLLFTHDKIREVVYARISPLRRERLHRRAAETLEQVYAHQLDDYAPHIARHFAITDDPRALAYFQRAGDAAARLYAYAYAEAAAHFARAIELTLSQERRQPGQTALRASLTALHFKQASMHNQMAQYEASLKVLSHLASLARRARSTRARDCRDERVHSAQSNWQNGDLVHFDQCGSGSRLQPFRQRNRGPGDRPQCLSNC